MLTIDSASAGFRRFKVTPLCKVEFGPSADSNGTAGINSKGQVVYGFGPHPTQVQTWVWLPATDYNMPAGWYNIGNLPGLPQPNIGRDISESGKIGGQSGGITIVETGSSGEATVFTLGSTVTFQRYGTLGGLIPWTWSGANAINNQTPAVVVGFSSIMRSCTCALGDPLVQRVSGFSLTLNGTPMVELPPNGTAPINVAWDVNTPASGAARSIGMSRCAVVACPGPPSENPDPCLVSMSPMVWQGLTGTPSPRFNGGGAEIRAINDSNEMVGFAYSSAVSGECFRKPMYWATPGSVPIALPMPPGMESRPAVGVAINNSPLPQAVGYTIGDNDPLLWEKQSDGSWSVLLLNSDLAIGSCASTPGNSRWEIRQPHDVNNNGWIVALAHYWNNASPVVPEGWYMVLLTPDPRCEADVTGDGCIGINDLLAVIGNWNAACPQPAPQGLFPAICTLPDVTCDYVVNIDDLLVINNAWCPDPCDWSPCCLGCAQCTGGAGGAMGAPAGQTLTGPLTQAELIGQVLQSSQPANVQAEIIQAILEH